MSDDRPRLDATSPRAASLETAAAARDEERFAAAIEAVLHEPDAGAAGLLAPYLGLGAGIGRLAAHGLLKLGVPALPVLLEALQASDEARRRHAAWALGSLNDPRATDALLRVVEEPGASTALVSAALASLAELGDRRVVGKLRTLLRAPSHLAVRADLCRALGHIGDVSAVPDLAPLLDEESALLRLRAGEAMVRLLDRRGWPVLFEVLQGADRHGDSMIAALRGLGDLSSALTSFVGDEQYHLRREAAELLGTFGDPLAVPPLLEALRDINPWVRGAAAYSLGRLADRRALKGLLAALEDSSAWVRLCAVRGLGLLGDGRAVKALEKMLFVPETDVAAAAQEAIGLLVGP